MTHRKTLLSRSARRCCRPKLRSQTPPPAGRCRYAPAVTPIAANPVLRAAMRTAVTKIDAGLNLADPAMPPGRRRAGRPTLSCWRMTARPVCHNGVICAA